MEKENINIRRLNRNARRKGAQTRGIIKDIKVLSRFTGESVEGIGKANRKNLEIKKEELLDRLKKISSKKNKK